MANRTALRLDSETKADLEFLVSIFGTQTAAVKAAVAELARRQRILANMAEYVAAVEAEDGPLTQAEIDQAQAYFQ